MSKNDDPEADDSQDEADKHNACHETLLHLEVYLCADRLGFDHLKRKTSEIFLETIDVFVPSSGDDFARVVDYVLQHTQSESFPLLLALVSCNVLHLCDQKTMDVFRDRVPAQAVLARGIQGELVQAECNLRRKKDDHDKTLAQLESQKIAYGKLQESMAKQVEQIEKRFVAPQHRLDTAMSLLNKLDQFHHCPDCGRLDAVKFAGIPTNLNNFPYKLKCTNCGSDWFD